MHWDIFPNNAEFSQDIFYASSKNSPLFLKAQWPLLQRTEKTQVSKEAKTRNNEHRIYYLLNCRCTGFSYTNIRPRSLDKTRLPILLSLVFFPPITSPLVYFSLPIKITEVIIQQYRCFLQKHFFYSRQMSVLNCLKCNNLVVELDENYDNLPAEDLPLRNDSIGRTLANLFPKQKSQNSFYRLVLSHHSGRRHWHIKIKQADNSQQFNRTRCTYHFRIRLQSCFCHFPEQGFKTLTHTHTFNFYKLVSHNLQCSELNSLCKGPRNQIKTISFKIQLTNLKLKLKKEKNNNHILIKVGQDLLRSLHTTIVTHKLWFRWLRIIVFPYILFSKFLFCNTD